jgi:hypothetical protein
MTKMDFRAGSESVFTARFLLPFIAPVLKFG